MTGWRTFRSLMTVIGLALLLGIRAAPAATFVVTSSADTSGSTCGSVCTLRQAITAANATSAADTINFAIVTVPPRGDILIQPGSNLPAITQPLTINGYSQGGSRANDSVTASNATLRIRIDGALNSASHGLAICAGNTTVRGIAVTRFVTHGIIVGDTPCASSVSNVQLHGNFIGTTGGGSAAAGNTGAGIRVASSQVSIGSTALADRNLVSANGVFGIELRGSFSGNSEIRNNLIGTDRTGSQDFGNGIGIRVSDSYNNAFIAQNSIRFNTTGIHVNGGVNSRISENLIFDNDALGIDLGALGVTPNDPDDLDNGPNQLQNFPAIVGAGRGAGTLNFAADVDVGHTTPIVYTAEVFASASCDASGNGEGERFIGAVTGSLRQSNERLSAAGGIPTSDPLPPGTVITATVRSANAVGTSEFSTCFPLDPPPLVVNSNDDVNDGTCNAIHCSLREAILAGNATIPNGQQFINFAIPPLSGSSEIVIAPSTPLPRITSPMLIDGYSQPGSVENTDPDFSNALLRIRLNGSAGALVGLDVCTPGFVVRGLAFTGFEEAVGFQRSGCSITSGGSVAGNFFGLRADGTTAGNNQRSIVFSGLGGAPLLIGGIPAEDRNVFAGGTVGIDMDAQGSNSAREVLGNLFGSDRSGAQNRAIGTAILVTSSSNGVVIGSADAPNRFRFNGRALAVTGSAQKVRAGNNIYADSGVLALDLGADGVTPNDPGDGDSGPNGLLNFPVLTLAERNVNGVRVIGTVDVPGVPSAGSLSLNFYASTSCHPSGHGDGEALLGSASVGESFDVLIDTDVDLVAQPFITATATHTEGSSEMSACLQATDPPIGIAVDSNLDSLTVDGGCDLVGDANLCTLREAILLANSLPGPDRIRFQIGGGSGPQIIQPVAMLPVISGGLTIDGYTQAGSTPNAASNGFDAVLRIELQAVSLPFGLRICTAEAVEISGIAFIAGTGPMIATRINDSSSCALGGSLRVRGCQFGLRAAGASSAVTNAIQANGSVLTVGGPTPADRNLIARSTGAAVRVVGAASSASVIQNNLFGRDGEGLNHPNLRDIDIVDAANVVVGGEGPLANALFGSNVAIFVSGANADFNRLYGNTFALHSGATAIDLADGVSPDGITANDPDDADSGANDGQNTPVLMSGAVVGQSITIQGTLDVPAGIVNTVNYRLAFYRSTQCNDAPGVGREGETFLGSQLFGFSSSSETFNLSLSASPEAGFITATATAPDGSTSEFSNCLVAPQTDLLHADGFE
ncbi:MAG: CSLREA domain-containing protein [Lysobacterales bacterium]